MCDKLEFYDSCHTGWFWVYVSPFLRFYVPPPLQTLRLAFRPLGRPQAGLPGYLAGLHALRMMSQEILKIISIASSPLPFSTGPIYSWIRPCSKHRWLTREEFTDAFAPALFPTAPLCSNPCLAPSPNKTPNSFKFKTQTEKSSEGVKTGLGLFSLISLRFCFNRISDTIQFVCLFEPSSNRLFINSLVGSVYHLRQ